MKIDAGALDRQITFLTKTTARDDVGFVVETWAPGVTVAAQRLELRTTDIARGAGTQSIPAGRYLIRWRAGLTTAMRARIDGADYSITAIDEPDRRTTLVLMVEGISVTTTVRGLRELEARLKALSTTEATKAGSPRTGQGPRCSLTP